jgi:drug/metabolite transporter (DMT)-like permease
MFVVLREFNNNGALVFPVFNISVIIASFLTAIVFFKEKFYWYNFIGLAFAILAIVMIAS